LNLSAHTIHHADLLAHLRGNRWLVQNGYIPKAHAILCDPPYGLEFMGKEWDKPKPSGLMATRSARDPKYADTSKRPYLAASVNQYVAGEDFQAWVTEWAGLLIDYVHPGALGLFFGGTRTYHRLAAGLEDAGWEITDCIMWVHAQGFPKSASIGKLLDKEAGAAREVVGVHPYLSRKPNGSSGIAAVGLGDHPTLTAPSTPLAARWEGYGTALKPAFEPVVVCRAPRGKRTYAALAREFGTGALAIDAARISTNGEQISIGLADSKRRGVNDINEGWKRPWMEDGEYHAAKLEAAMERLNTLGRWPANFALVCTCESDDHHFPSCPVAVLGAQSGETGNGYRANPSVKRDQHQNAVYGKYQDTFEVGERGHDDTGTAARFFYQAKAAAWERIAGLSARSTHPTHKPIRLAEYLARLILPPAGDTPRRLLVPFAGSGSEMIGALLAGWDEVTGIEREAEYVDLARARVGWWAQFATYDEARAAYEQERKAKPDTAPSVVTNATLPRSIARCPDHDAAQDRNNRKVYQCGCRLVYAHTERATPVVIDEKPYTLPMLIMEAVNT
jgi:DNA modification methylase